MIFLFPNVLKITLGVIRFKILFDAMMVPSSSSGLNSEYGSYPFGMISPIVFFNAVKFYYIYILI